MGFIIRIMLILGLIGYIAEGKYKDVPDPPKIKTNDALIRKIHKEGVIGYVKQKKKIPESSDGQIPVTE